MPQSEVVNEQLESIRLGASFLFRPKQLVEVRARVGNYWRGFYFDDHDYMATIVEQLDSDERVQSLYYVFNEINSQLITQRETCPCDKCAQGGLIVKNPTAEQIEKILTGPSQHLTADEDIVICRWFFIDIDTVRAVGHDHDSSTNEEKAASQRVANEIVKFLDARGWAAPMLANSGNGWHIYYLMEQPNTSTTVGNSDGCLRALSAKFSNEVADIDESVFNPARLTRAYGTTTRKGGNTAERPHRRNRLIKPKNPVERVGSDQLAALAAEAPKKRVLRGDMPELHRDFDPEEFFEWYEEQGAFSITGSHTWQSKPIKVTDRCIIAGHKHTGSGLTGFIIGDTFGYHCFSDDCTGITIADVLRQLAEEGYKPFPKPIWVEEPILLNFDKNQEEFSQLLQEEGEQYKPPKVVALDEPGYEEPEEVVKPEGDTEPSEEKSIIDKLEERIVADTIAEAAESGVALPPPAPAKKKPIRIGDVVPNEYAIHLMTVIFRDPKKAILDYGFYRSRLERVSRHLTDTVREVFGAMVFFERANKFLPTKDELIDYILHSEDCFAIPIKNECATFIKAVEDNGKHFFDTTAKRLIAEMDWRLESEVVRRAFKEHLKKDEAEVIDIEAFRTALRKHWASSIGFNSDFKPGSWQENADLVYEAFRRDLSGEGDARKFKLGFDAIDNSGMNIGLDGNHAIVLYGPAANRKTNAAMTIALNFAMQGKRGLFLAGEHLREKVEKRLTLMLSYYLRKTQDNPDGIVPIIPGLAAWEGLNRNVTEEDLKNIGTVLAELKAMRVVPGYLEVQNINSLIRGEEDPLGTIMNYIDSTHKKYEWDFVIIDPLDSILPVEMGENKNQFQASAAIVDRLFDYSRGFAGDRGLLIVVTAQFRAETRRNIEKIQAKNGGGDDFDDEIIAILRGDSNIQYIGNKLTQRFDLAIGVALREKDGNQGMLVLGRSRETGTFDVMPFEIDPDSNLMLESKSGISKRVHPNQSDTPPETLADVPYDIL